MCYLLNGPNSPDCPLTKVLVAISSSFLALFSIVLIKTEEHPAAARHKGIKVKTRYLQGQVQSTGVSPPLCRLVEQKIK